MIIRSKVPFRISFGGGGTDTLPYCSDYGGVVLSTSIDKYAYVSLKLNNSKKINVTSIDYDLNKTFNLGNLPYDGNLDLFKAVNNEFKPNTGFNLIMHSDMPPGSGMGTSSSMTAALIGCLAEFSLKKMSREKIAKLAYHIERVELDEKGGYQDQYAAVFGGFNFMEFSKEDVVVNPLNLSQSTLNELHYHLLLFYIGNSRLSSDIHKDMAKQYNIQDNYLERLHKLKYIAKKMKVCLTEKNLDGFGELLHDGWIAKRELSEKITTSKIDKLYDIARKNGGIGGKTLGAGGGGYLLIFCKPKNKFDLVKKLSKYGAIFVPFNFESNGLHTWRNKHGSF